jgi:hypothetical protein
MDLVGGTAAPPGGTSKQGLSRLWISLAAAPVVLCSVGTPVGVLVGLILRKLVHIPEAIGFGFTTGALVALGLVVACSPPALRRGLLPVLAAGTGAYLLGWPVRILSVGHVWMIAAVLGPVVGGGVAGLLVWWRAGTWPYRRPVVVGGLAVLLVLLVAVPLGTLFTMSAGFGTRGDGSPESAVDSWLSSAFPGSFDRPERGNLARVTCNRAGGRQAMRFFDQYVAWESRHHIWFDETWDTVHSQRHGSTATILASVDLTTTQPDGMSFDMGTGNGPWRFTVDDIQGWRVCGLSVPKTPPSPNSASVTPSPTGT